MDEALVGRAYELVPVLVDVSAEGRTGLADLTVDGELEQVLQLVLVQALADEVELDRRLLDSLGEVALVEGEAELSVLEHVIGARLVISSACGLVHGVGASLRMRVLAATVSRVLNEWLQQKGTQGPRRRVLPEFAPPEVVVDQSGGLHRGVGRRRADEDEAPALELLRQTLGLRGGRLEI